MTIKILKDKERSNCELGEVKIIDAHGDGPGCESSCYVPPFHAVISDGQTWWCTDCAQSAFEVDGEDFTDENFDQIRKECREREKVYIKERYEKLYGRAYSAEEIRKKIDEFSQKAPASFIVEQLEEWFQETEIKPKKKKKL